MMRNKSTKGFTLIELMIVVAIIGILAAIAIPNFLRFQLKSKTSEGKVNIAAIRTAEESYLAEYGSYVPANISPPVGNQNQKVAFVNAGGPGTDFDVIGWSPEGDVFFTYSVAVTPAFTGFTADAVADIDANGTPQVWGYVANQPPVGGVPGPTIAGTQGCPATGTWNSDPANLGNNLLKTVGPCAANFGQSEF